MGQVLTRIRRLVITQATLLGIDVFNMYSGKNNGTHIDYIIGFKLLRNYEITS
jgi:hypothetical protein